MHQTITLNKAVEKLLKERGIEKKEDVRNNSESAVQKLEDNLRSQITKLEDKNKDLEKKVDTLNMALLKASENVTKQMIELTKGLLIDKAKTVAELNDKIQVLSLKVGQIDALETANKQLSEREEELRKLLPAILSRLR